MKHDDAFPCKTGSGQTRGNLNEQTVFPKGGVQLVAPSPKPGRLVVCSSAYWTGGEMKDGNIIKPGDRGSRYSFTMIRCRNALLILPPFLLLMKARILSRQARDRRKQNSLRWSRFVWFRAVTTTAKTGGSGRNKCNLTTQPSAAWRRATTGPAICTCSGHTQNKYHPPDYPSTCP